jgi:hypothetical protein
MPLPELRREIPPSLQESSNLITSLALRAEAVLGYSWLRKRLKIEPGSLAQALIELAIEPFRVEDVKKYKKERARLTEQQAFNEYRKCARCDGYAFLPPGTYVKATWHVVPLDSYQGEVPEFALSRALEIKERIPSVEFEIEELHVDKRYDPFLIASCGGERFYIDVWEEENFEDSYT